MFVWSCFFVVIVKFVCFIDFNGYVGGELVDLGGFNYVRLVWFDKYGSFWFFEC